MEINQSQPWLTAMGLEIPTEQLKEVSRQWDLETWEAYLQWFESAQHKSLDPSESDISKIWQGVDKKILEDAALKELSRAWEQADWEQFLAATVDGEMSRHETLLDHYNTLVEESSEHSWTGFTTIPVEVQRKVRWALRQLTSVQRTVIYGIFFHGLPRAEVAQKLGITRQTANVTKKISLNKIKHLIELDPYIAAYLIGGSKNLTQREQTREQEILEVYFEDLKGSYMK